MIPLWGWASPDLDFGLGDQASGRAGAVTAESDNAFAARLNPALISAQPRPLFGFSVGGAEARYAPLPRILVDSHHFHTEAAQTRSSEYTPAPTSLTVWGVGITYPIRSKALGGRTIGVGASLSGPVGKLASLSARSPYDFTSLRYGSGDALFKGTFSTAIEAVPDHLYLGAGVNLFISSIGNSDALLSSDNPTGRFAMDIALQAAAVAGAFARFRASQASLVYYQGIHPTFTQSFNGRMSWGGSEVFQQPMRIRTTLCDEPGRLEADVQHDFGVVKASLGVSYQRWSDFRPSFLIVEAPDASGTTRTTELGSPSLRDTLNPRISLEAPVVPGTLSVSGGYQFRPTPVRDLSGASNLLDTQTHVLGASLQYRMPTNAVWNTPLVWSLYGQHHWMARREVNKASETYIGAPGYAISGRAYAYGVALGAEL